MTNSSSDFPSGVMKQLKKNPVSDFQSIDYWKAVYLRNTLETPMWFIGIVQWMMETHFSDSSDIEKDLTFLLHSIETPHELIPSQPTPWLTHIEKQHRLTAINSSILDLYTILRMLKKPSEGISPTIAFGFFGDIHTQNISHFFQFLGYSVVSEQKLDAQINRCITFNDSIYLDQDIAAYHEKRINSMNLRKRYQAQLENEKKQKGMIKKNRINQISTQRRNRYQQLIHPFVSENYQN
jgi:hypothetical protein